MKKYYCAKCKEISFVEIDPESSHLFCGIIGFYDAKNVKIHDGVCECAICSGEIYTESR